MRKKLRRDLVFALRGWTIRNEGEKFYASPTAHFDDKEKWHGPYKSLQATCTAIARKLQEEFVARQKRVTQ